MKTVLSGIQPTGNLHLGNYLGSVRNWLDLQGQYDCYFGIMDLHAITLPQDPKELRQNVRDALCVYLACGLDAEKSTFFVQSQVPAITAISWAFSCLTSMGALNRMTQFKDKASNSDSGQDNARLGLYAYPVLMAADILAFKSDLVPVGDLAGDDLNAFGDARSRNRAVAETVVIWRRALAIKELFARFNEHGMGVQAGSKNLGVDVFGRAHHRCKNIRKLVAFVIGVPRLTERGNKTRHHDLQGNPDPDHDHDREGLTLYAP